MNNEIHEMTPDELDIVSGGNWFSAAVGALGNVLYDLMKKESENGFVANAVRQTGNTPGR